MGGGLGGAVAEAAACSGESRGPQRFPSGALLDRAQVFVCRSRLPLDAHGCDSSAPPAFPSPLPRG